MGNTEWNNFVDDMEDCMDYDLSHLKTDGKPVPSAMPLIKTAETPSYHEVWGK